MSDTDQPDPASTPGLESGGGEVAGDTPPMAGSQSEATTRTGSTPNQAPPKATKTPMVIGLVFVALVVLAVLGYGIAEIYAYLSS